MTQQVEWTRPARNDLTRLDHQTRERIRQAVYRLALDGYGDIRRLRGADDER